MILLYTVLFKLLLWAIRNSHFAMRFVSINKQIYKIFIHCLLFIPAERFFYEIKLRINLYWLYIELYYTSNESRIVNCTWSALTLWLNKAMLICTGYCHSRVRKSRIFLRLFLGWEKEERIENQVLDIYYLLTLIHLSFKNLSDTCNFFIIEDRLRNVKRCALLLYRVLLKLFRYFILRSYKLFFIKWQKLFLKILDTYETSCM